MRLTAVLALLSIWVLAATMVAAAAAVPSTPDEPTAQIGPPSFLPWPPLVPLPGAPDAPPIMPTADPFDPAAVTATLQQVLAAVQADMDQMWQWLDQLRQAAAGALTQIVTPLPVPGPPQLDPLAVVTQIAALPAEWRAIVADAIAKLSVSTVGDATAAQHGAEISDSPQLSHEAATIAEADQQVTSETVQHEVAIQATAAVARAAAEDGTLPAEAAAASATGDALAANAQSLPSSRAGIELLVAGMGAGLRHQAAFTTALAGRLSGLLQQNAQLSGQVGALASTVGVLTERDLERDGGALNAQLGAADAAHGAADLFGQLLEGAYDTAGEIPLTPLY
jgi:hypothetical protein